MLLRLTPVCFVDTMGHGATGVSERHAGVPRTFLHIHRVFSNLKAWLNGTHHGVDPKYLQSYLDEFVFRFNRRNTPMAAFQTLLGISTQKPPLTLPELVTRSQP